MSDVYDDDDGGEKVAVADDKNDDGVETAPFLYWCNMPAPMHQTWFFLKMVHYMYENGTLLFLRMVYERT